MNYPQFTGTKFRPIGKTVITYNRFDEPVIKELFCCTRQYRKYLDDKYEYEKQQKFLILIEKIKFQFEKYHEVDELSLNIAMQTVLNKINRYKNEFGRALQKDIDLYEYLQTMN